MDFFELLAVAKWLLERRRHISYRTLKRELRLDDETLENLRHELIVGTRLAADDDGKALVWTGGADLPKTLKTAHSDTLSASASSSTAFDKSVTPAGKLRPVAHSESLNDVPAETLSPPAPSPVAERRQLTVMFCDLVGSTALSAKLDPEDLREVITSFQDECREAIERYAGFIARYMGDGMLVYFGYPQAHEDDAERAVRAGLDIVRSIVELNTEFGRRHEVVLAVRVGVATGPVVVGDIVGEGAAEEAAVVGETPNLAARLQGLAEPNQVVVSVVTHQLLGASFDCDDLGSHELKGLAQSVQVWQVVSERDIDSRFEAKRAGGGLPLVGRQEELGLLARYWEASQGGHGQVVFIQGEAGIGKSRLLEALRDQIVGADYTWVAIRCSPYHANSTLYPVIEHLKRAFGWKPEDDNDAKLDKLEAALNEESLRLEEVVPLYAELLSLALPEGRYASLDLNPKQKREQSLDALVARLTEEAERRPVLLVWEDVHWADPTTLELLGIYLDQSPTVPMLNVLTYRPEFSPPWSMRSHMTPITLNRLERPEVEALIRHQAGGKAVPQIVLEHIVEKGDGVPLFVEELTKTILKSENLAEHGNEYVLKGSLAEMQIPSTLQDSLMARLDRAPTMREVAQVGAVLGREFAYEILNAIVGLEEPQLKSGLKQLVENELLYQRGRPPRSKYIFKHALIQDAAYQSLLKRTRQQYHLQVGQLLEARFPEMVEAHPELLAHHYTEGGAAKEAITASHTAGELASSRGANQEAVTHLSNGLSVANDLPDDRERARYELKLQISLGGVYLQMKGHSASEVEVAFARARELCEQLGDAPELVPTLFGLWRTYVVQMEGIEKHKEVAAQLLRHAKDEIDPVPHVVAHYAAGFTSLVMAEFSAAGDHLREGTRRYALDDRDIAEVYRFGQDPGVACRCYLAMTDWVLGYPDRAREHARDGLALAEGLDDPFSLAYALAFASWVDQFQDNRKGILEKAKKAIRLATEKGFPYWLSIGKVLEGWVEAATNPVHATIQSLRDRVADHRALGTNLFMPSFLALVGDVALRARQTDVCGAILDEAEAFLERTGERWWETEIHRLQGELLLARNGDYAEAESRFEKALAFARERNAKSFELRAAMSLARLWQRQGKRNEGRELLAPIYVWFTEGFDTSDLQAARLLLGEPEASDTEVTG
ncbi:MAG: AAA family ATPase [Acidiferrobacterales bacterium]